MFSQLYFHKVRRIYDYHIARATKAVLHELKLQDDCYPSPDQLENYLYFDDWAIWGEMKHGLGGQHGKIIINRKHFKCVFETEIVPTEQDEQQLIRLEEEKHREQLETHLDSPSTTWYKFDKDIAIIKKDNAIITLSELSNIVKSMIAIPLMKRLYAGRLD